MLLRMWNNRHTHLLLVGIQKSPTTLEESLTVSYKTKHTLTIQSSKHATRYLCTQRTETYVNRKTCTWMFIADLFINAKTWKQPRCSSVGKWIYKLWYIQTMGYFSALKRNELYSHEKIWRKIKCILQSEKSQSEKATYCIISTIWHSGKGKIMETVKRSMVARDWECMAYPGLCNQVNYSSRMRTQYLWIRKV